jgi:selenophosphate synthetase-related protein
MHETWGWERGREGVQRYGGDALLIDLNGIGVPERREAEHELIEQDSQSPPVDSSRVALALDDLWGQILRGAAQRVGFPLALVNITLDICPFEPRPRPLLRLAKSANEREEILTVAQPLGKAEVDQLDVPVRI